MADIEEVQPEELIQKRTIDQVSPNSDESNCSPGNKVRRQKGEIADLLEEHLNPILHRVSVLEKHNQVLQSQVDELEEARKKLQGKIKEMEDVFEEDHQRSRRCNIRIHGLGEHPQENTDDAVMYACKNLLKVDVDPSEIEKSNRLGIPMEHQTRPRPVLLQVTSHRVKRRIMNAVKSNRKITSKEKVFFSEDLTKKRVEIVSKARELLKQQKILSVWSDDGIVKVRKLNKNICVIKNMKELDQFAQPASTDTHHGDTARQDKSNNHQATQNQQPGIPVNGANQQLQPKVIPQNVPGRSMAAFGPTKSTPKPTRFQEIIPQSDPRNYRNPSLRKGSSNWYFRNPANNRATNGARPKHRPDLDGNYGSFINQHHFQESALTNYHFDLTMEDENRSFGGNRFSPHIDSHLGDPPGEAEDFIVTLSV